MEVFVVGFAIIAVVVVASVSRLVCMRVGGSFVGGIARQPRLVSIAGVQ